MSAGRAGLQQHVELQGFNTFGVRAHAAYFCAAHDLAMLRDALAAPALHGLPRLILGGGSNLLLTRDFPGLVLHVRLLGKRIVEREGETALIEAAAGEPWHTFVQWTLEQGYAGLENLSLIPGYVGASPIQNIGAYGVEMKDVFDSLDAYDLTTQRVQRFDAAACEFAYRDSVFKRAARDRYIVLAVRFRLSRRAALHLDYGEVRAELGRMNIAQPSALDVSNAVCAIRRRKLPDPAQIGNAGSFFKNPIVPEALAAELGQRLSSMPRYPAPQGLVKLAAGWLIEQAGWKGKRVGDAGVHPQHALVLVNYGNASGVDILALARAIQDSVQARFGIALEPEPVIVSPKRLTPLQSA